MALQALETNSAMASHILSQASQSVINSFQLELHSALLILTAGTDYPKISFADTETLPSKLQHLLG